ncbi:MAG: hypothetical protein A2283_08160 [Lentisphaerae bacterium RIFOXYA12_FULL_48_11]|nr:MAG: hypothetical protein A2283_08160 [Lentisphaerae bacterium RIFOXYA12_FULL_48_11]
MAITPDSKPKKTENAVYRIVDEQAVIVEPKKGLVNVVNDVGSRIWTEIDGNHSVGQIAGIITSEYAISASQALKDTAEFLNELENNQLITVST